MESSEISSSEWISINQFLHEIKLINSTCVSVYYPYGKGHEIISLLDENHRTATIERIESKIKKEFWNLEKIFHPLENSYKLFVFLVG